MLGRTVKQHSACAPTTSSLRKSDCPSRNAPERCLPPEEFCWGSVRERRRIRAGRRNSTHLNAGRQRRGGDRAEAGMLISRRAVSPAARACNRRSSRATLARSRNCSTRGASAPHTSNGIVSSRLDSSSQFAGVSRPLRRDHADLGQVAAQAVQQRVRWETSISRACGASRGLVF